MEDKIKEAIELLTNKSSKKRESGAKRLRKLDSKEAGSYLVKALEKFPRKNMKYTKSTADEPRLVTFGYFQLNIVPISSR